MILPETIQRPCVVVITVAQKQAADAGKTFLGKHISEATQQQPLLFHESSDSKLQIRAVSSIALLEASRPKALILYPTCP